MIAYILEKLKKAYGLGYERAGIKVDIEISRRSIQNGNTANEAQIPEWRKQIVEIDQEYKRLSLLEKLAFDFGNCED